MASETLRAATFLDKGGTGKTTMTAHFGVALEDEGYDVLLIDLAGKQGDLANYLGVDSEDSWPNITTVFQSEWEDIVKTIGSKEEAVGEIVINSSEGPDIIPAHEGLDTLNDELVARHDDANARYSQLSKFLRDYIDPLDKYDIILLDLPGVTNNVTYNGLWATHNVMLPVEMGPLEFKQAKGLKDDLKNIGESYGAEIELTMIIPNKVDRRTNLAKEYLEKFEDEFSEAIAPETVPNSQDLRNAVDKDTTAFSLDNPSRTAEQAREAISTNAKELVNRLKKNQTEAT